LLRLIVYSTTVLLSLCVHVEYAFLAHGTRMIGRMADTVLFFD